jgi:hypothetical protein
VWTSQTAGICGHIPVIVTAMRLGTSPVDVTAMRLETSHVDVTAMRLETSPIDVTAMRLETSPVDVTAMRLETSPVDVTAMRWTVHLGVHAVLFSVYLQTERVGWSLPVLLRFSRCVIWSYLRRGSLWI